MSREYVGHPPGKQKQCLLRPPKYATCYAGISSAHQIPQIGSYRALSEPQGASAQFLGRLSFLVSCVAQLVHLTHPGIRRQANCHSEGFIRGGISGAGFYDCFAGEYS